MLYKKPIITLTSLLDLLFILIFAYQMDIKTDADKYVQAEVEKRISLDIPDQSELVAELQEENQRVKDELEIVRKKTESANEYKLQSEQYKAQRDQLRNELQKKDRELVAVKQESESIKRKSKTEGVIPITDKDAELAKALVGTWKGSRTYRALDISERTIYNPDNSFIGYTTITGNRDSIVGTLRLNKGESVSSRISGKWWVKGGYIHYFVESSTNTKVFQIGHSSSSKILSVSSNTSRYKQDDGSINTEYRIK